jgi:HD-GYP domain-containing protein (c-di-GMP phosphodiesterase class II)
MTMSDEVIRRTLAGKTEEQMLSAFFVLYKTSRLVDENNATFTNQLNHFLDSFRKVASLRGEVVIKTIAGHLFVNDLMVPFDEHGLSGASAVIAEWKMLGVGGVRISADISDAKLGRFFKFMAGLRPDGANLESLAAQLTAQNISEIRILSVKAIQTDSPELAEEARRHFRQAARATFVHAMESVQDIVVNAGQDQEINIAKTKRVVHSLIDQITRDEQSMIELTAIRDYDDYTYAHSINVTIYALTVGVRLGLDRARLSQLGFAGLFHDVGKIRLPSDLIRKPDAYDENDWIQMQRHPLLGAKTILRNMELNVHTARAARAAFEHHIHSDFTGYPRLHHDRRTTNLFSQIISIVDSFDALASGRVYLKKSIPPDEVLKKMRFQMNDKFDPFLLKLFNDIVGIYPAGTLILLTTDEIALVLTNNREQPARPYVKVVGNRHGLLDQAIWIDLSQPEYHDRRIVRRIDPDRYGLRTRDFVLSD